MPAFRLTSSAFADGEAIPERFGYQQENVNPPLAIEGVPEGAASLALIVDDPDVVEPAGTVWDHWLVWSIPPDTASIPEGWHVAAADAVEGRTDYGEVGYGGPNPPDSEHTYRFRLYALDRRLDLDPGDTSDDLREALDGHVIGETELTGTYTPQ
jgi:Raf kinase inhibitor-like YbhB/YbcL family protein